MGDTVYATKNGDIVQGDINTNILYGTNADQTANYSNLTINGAGSDDTIYGATMTASSAYGNAGDDELHADSSTNSSYYGGIGNDSLYADTSSGNTFYGDAGADVFYGGSSANATVYGGTGNNTYYGDNASGTISYYGGDDGNTVQAGALAEGSTLAASGGSGDDTFYGNTAQGEVTFSGGGGNDVYYSGSAADVTITDSAGTDSLYIDGTQNLYTTSTDGDTLTIASTALGQTLVTQGIEDFYFSDGNGGWLHYSFDELSTHIFYASASNETINATIASETLYGTNEGASEQYSNLTINAAGGDDVIYAGNMLASSAYGNAGDDTLYAGTSVDSNFYGGTGNDTFHGDSAQNATFYGDGVLDTFHADSSTDSAFYGGAGVSVFYGESATGTIEFYGGNGGNTVYAGTLASGSLSASGGAGSDTFYGNTAQGEVTFSGGDGNDVYYSGSAADVTITDSAGTDSLYIDGTQNLYTTSTDGETLTIASTALGQTLVTQGVEDFYFSDGNGGWLHYTYDELSTHTFYASEDGETINGTIAAETLYGTNEDGTAQYSNLTINAAGGNDTIYGSNMVASSAYGNAGDDVLYAGTSDHSQYYGGTGNDEFHAGSSTYGIFYGDGVIDTFNAENSHNGHFYGGAGLSYFYGGNAKGSVEFYGGDGGNRVYADQMASGTTLNAYGGANADQFHGNVSHGFLNFYGGAGNDLYSVESATNVTVSDSSGIDSIYLKYDISAYTIVLDPTNNNAISLNTAGDTVVVYAQGVEDFYFRIGTTDLSHYTYNELLTHEFYASESNQTIDGTPESDLIYGTNADFTGEYTGLTLYGEGDNDSIYGGLMGNSAAYGGAGADYLDGSSSYSSVFYGGEGDDRIQGGGVNNTFYGDNGLDEIYAGASENGTFYGGGGSNTFSADQAVGSVTYYGGDVGDIVNAGSIGTNTSLNAYGGSGSDVFNAQAAQGNVNFYGGEGSDVYHADSASNVSVSDAAGTDSLYLDYSRSLYTVRADKDLNALDLTDNGAHQNVFTQGIDDFYFSNGDGTYTHYTYDELACFLTGTRIRTPGGEVAIETLKAGDLVLTTTGEAKPVLWVGHRTVATRFAHPLTALPIHIRPDALDRGLPERDLFVSPDHAFFIGGMLVQAGALVNGVTITRHRDLPETFTYYHVELLDHDLIYAEGLPAETFIDNLERETFDNAAEFPGRSRPALELDLPRVKSRRQMPKALARALEARTARLAQGGPQAA
ncbi:Hint domain-containing protein [Aquabacter sp. L1I39]|uniref:Hint domain-containing protein n=1 Tax=Aquabacter sp. L1I39 TaxID=2820278 RepID=UPI001ADCDCB5|nr:Hint domain-containing protein [Aquabacter sp. L1I39]QTL02635.1 Hint domain-containing protein [Aquabacter sp. L1I39]